MRVGDANIEVHVEGAGSPLLMIIGLAAHAGTWGEAFLQPLRARFQIIRFSPRGTGLSDPIDGPLSMGAMARDAAALLGELGISRAAVLGISMGGNVAQELALSQPAMVASLILGCTNCGPSHSVAQSPETMARFGQIASLPPDEQTREFCVAMVSPHFAQEKSDTLDALIGMHMGTAPETFAHHMIAIMTFDSYDRLPDIQARTRIIHGDQDIVIPVANATVLEERIPNADVRIMAGVGHMFVWERPQEAAEMIIEFLAN